MVTTSERRNSLERAPARATLRETPRRQPPRVRAAERRNTLTYPTATPLRAVTDACVPRATAKQARHVLNAEAS